MDKCLRLLTSHSCLYHTYRILLYRPMLSRHPSAAEGASKPDLNHILYCVRSATAIIRIFDLFCRSFGYDRCVLALSYAVYTAASIFLLQVQAATVQDDQTLRKLHYCIIVLARVKTVNSGSYPFDYYLQRRPTYLVFTLTHGIVICSSLRLLTGELSKIGIDLTTPPSDTPPFARRGNEFLPSHQTEKRFVAPDTSSHVISSLNPTDPENLSLLHYLDPDGLEIIPEMSEAFLSLEPLSETVGTLPDFQ